MTNAQLLLAVILLQQGLFGVVWAIAARLRLAPRPARHWAAATWLVAAGMSLILLRGILPLWLTLGVANLLLVVSFVMLRRGIQIFARQRPTDAEHIAVVVLSGFGLAAAVVLAAQPMLLVLVTSAAMSWTLLRCGFETYHALRHEFGGSTARWCALPTLVIGSLLLLRGIVAFALGEQVDSSVATSGFKNAGLVYASLAFGLIINTTLFAMTVIRLVRRLQHQSDHDVLTDLLNRRAMQRLLAGEARRQKRLRGSYGVLSVDVDHFKAINDAHGHPVGDLMLQRVAQALRSAASRELDQVARMGGEEFFILLPGQDARGAERVARRVMEAVGHIEGPAAAPQMRITVSVGLAVVTGSDEEVEHTTALMKRLDDALLAAKANGRNCIVHASAAGSACAAGVPARPMPPDATPRPTPGAPEPRAAAPAQVEAPAVLEFD